VARLVFTGRQALEITPRNPRVPREEQRTLDYLLVENARSGEYHLRFIFLDGTTIAVRAHGYHVVAE